MVPRRLLQLARALVRDRSARLERGLSVFEGVRLAEAALEARVPCSFVLYSPALCQTARGSALLSAYRASPVIRLFEVPHSTLGALSGTVSSAGVLGVFSPHTWQLSTFVASGASVYSNDCGASTSTSAERRDGMILALAGVGDPGNLGTAARSAEALGAAGMLLLASGVDPHCPKAVRSGRGATFRCPIVQASTDPAHALGALRAAGRRIYFADGAAAGGMPPWSLDLRSAVIIVGGETAGVSPAIRALADGAVAVPMPCAASDSLNAGSAAAILAYEALRQRRENLQL